MTPIMIEETIKDTATKAINTYVIALMIVVTERSLLHLNWLQVKHGKISMHGHTICTSHAKGWDSRL